MVVAGIMADFRLVRGLRKDASASRTLPGDVGEIGTPLRQRKRQLKKYLHFSCPSYCYTYTL
jgi:hypothetical protein